MNRIEFRKNILEFNKKERLLMNQKNLPYKKNIDWQIDKDGIFLFPSIKRNSIKQTINDTNEFHFSLLGGKIEINKQIRFLKLPIHRHDYIGINFVYSGFATLVVNDKIIDVSEGDICIMDSGVTHTIKDLGGNDIVFNIKIDPEYFTNDVLLRLSDGDVLTNFIINALTKGRESEQLYLIHTKKNTRIRNLFEDLFIEALNPGLCSDEFITSVMELIFIEIVRHYNSENQILSKEKNTVCILDILKYIDENAMDISLQDVSNEFNFSPKYISRLIKKETGKSFKTLQQEYKLKKVVFLLENSNLSIENIAKESGYSNLSFFYKKFLTRYNMTPGEYRNKKKSDFDSEHG